MIEKTEKLRVAPTKQTQRATFAETGATIAATEAQPGSLKALSSLVLSRNQARNYGATLPEKQRNFEAEKTPEKLREVAEGSGADGDHTQEVYLLADHARPPTMADTATKSQPIGKAKPHVLGRLSAPIPPTMRQWNFQRGWWDGEESGRPQSL